MNFISTSTNFSTNVTSKSISDNLLKIENNMASCLFNLQYICHWGSTNGTIERNCPFILIRPHTCNKGVNIYLRRYFVYVAEDCGYYIDWNLYPSVLPEFYVGSYSFSGFPIVHSYLL